MRIKGRRANGSRQPSSPLRRTLLIGLFASVLVSPVLALELKSPATPMLVVELYTSEGCSSCPPADAWLASFKQDPRLFESLLPLAFHVDYWDMLGWSDPFAKPAYSKRQRDWVSERRVSQPYTPGFVVNSQEWRGWFGQQLELPATDGSPGILHVSWPDKTQPLTLRFDTEKAAYERLAVNVAVLGMGLETEVQAGENRGRTLRHDFVVLSHQRHVISRKGNGYAAQIAAPGIPAVGQRRSVLAVWLSPLTSQRIIQAAAGYVAP